MKLTATQMVDRLNTKLIEYNQLTRVIGYTGKSISLSTGIILLDNNKDRFCKRLLSTKTILWASNIDNLLNGLITASEIRAKLSSIGGKAAQKKHGDTIKQNLNNGTSWNAGTKGQNIGTLGPRPQSVKNKISKKNSGSGNGMYGVKMSAAGKQVRSDIMKKKILTGEFTPNSNNRNTHWGAMLDGTKYRSSWEALYQFINEFAEYEKLRIQYELDSKNHVYIVDFIDHHNKLVIEVKPKELCTGEKFTAKMYSLREWAKNNGYDVLLVDKDWLRLQNIDIDSSRFDDNTERKIKALYETNQKN
jgi:hypothetical protein